MMRCRSCLTKADTETGICPVCGIDQNKSRKALTAEEKAVRRAARNIRLTAMFHLILSGGLVLMTPMTDRKAAILVLALINLLLALGLIRFDHRGYRLAVICYFGYGMANIITVQLLQIPVVLLLLYIVGNRSAKAIFERRLR